MPDQVDDPSLSTFGARHPQARVLIAHLTHSPYPYFQPGLAYLSVATSAVAIPDVLGLYVLLRSVWGQLIGFS